MVPDFVVKIVKAVLIAVVVTIVCTLLGTVLATLKVDIAVTIGKFLETWAAVIGVICGLWWYFFGTTTAKGA